MVSFLLFISLVREPGKIGAEGQDQKKEKHNANNQIFQDID
jgi:hypothetical protein